MGQRLSKRLAKWKTTIKQRNNTQGGRQFGSVLEVSSQTHTAVNMPASLSTSLPNVATTAHILLTPTPPASAAAPVRPPRRIDLLRKCSTRNIGRTAGVPILRGCPRCGTPIIVDGDNKHVRCVVCDTQFCFVCLQLSQSSGGQGCAAVCTVAPRQKVLRRMTDEELCAQFEQPDYSSQFADELNDLNLAICLSLEGINDSEDVVGEPTASSVVLDTCDLQPLSGHIQLTTEPCCVTLDETKINRAKMPCGHVISVEGLSHLTRSAIVTNRGHQILCPECEAEWEFFLVRHVLSSMLTPAELLEMAQKMSINKLARDDIKSCPNCATPYVKDADIDGNRVVCVFCSEELGKPVAFCWNCMEDWKGDGTGCGNAGCDTTTDWRLIALATCATKTIGRVSGVPVLRGCENCGALIEHTEACKHMDCNVLGCKHSFCFVCLKPCVNGNFQCGSYRDPCDVAPRQTSLPKGPK